MDVKILMLTLVILQASACAKMMSASGGKVVGKSASIMAARQASRSALRSGPSKRLVAEIEAMGVAATLGKDAEAPIASNIAKESSELEKQVFKKGGQVTPKLALRNTKDEFSQIVEDKIEDAMMDILYENLDRTNTLWDYAIFEIMQDSSWNRIVSYMKERKKFLLTEKVDFFLLMHGREVSGFDLSMREACYILSRYSEACRKRTIEYLLIDLSDKEDAVRVIKDYARRNRIKLNQRRI